MTTVSDTYQITKDQLVSQRPRADLKLKSIGAGEGGRQSLVDLVTKIEPEDTFILTPEEMMTLKVLRDGVALFYELYRQLAKPFPALAEEEPQAAPKPIGGARMDDFGLRPAPAGTGPAPLDPKVRRARDSITAYSLYAAANYVTGRLDELVMREHPGEAASPIVRQANYFTFAEGKEKAVTSAIAKYFSTLKGAVEAKDDAKKVRDGVGLASFTKDFFAFLRDEAAQAAKTLQAEDYKFDNLSFNVAEEFRFRGYEPGGGAAGPRTASLAFKPMKPEEVVGNTHAKKLILRYADRLALYDFTEQKNPIMERGGLAWSCLWDGFPGTGKTSLLKVGKTRLHERIQQIQDAWAKYGQLWQWVVLDDRFKDEFYGKSGKNFRAELARTDNTRMLHWIEWEDIDLWMEDRDNTTGGAGKDLLNIGMQFLDGGGTVIRGNAINNATTNEPTGLDNALRQRFHIRFDASGPETWYHFADLVRIKLKPLIASDKVAGVELGRAEPGNAGAAYKPFEFEEQGLGRGEAHTLSDETAAALEKCRIGDPAQVTYADIGRLCRAFKDIYPRFTGRPVHSISEALRDRSADFDVPEEWYERPDLFIAQPYARKAEILGELYHPISGLMVVEEIDRYYMAETRYVREKHEADVQRLMTHKRADRDANERLAIEGASQGGEEGRIVRELLSHPEIRAAIRKEMDKGG